MLANTSERNSAMGGLYFINSSGKNTNGTEHMVMYTAAVKFLQSESKNSKMYFSHPALEGVLTAKGAGSIGSIRGNVFRVNLDEVDGIPRTVEFIVRFGSELHDEHGGVGFSYYFESQEAGNIPIVEAVASDNDTQVHTLN